MLLNGRVRYLLESSIPLAAASLDASTEASMALVTVAAGLAGTNSNSAAAVSALDFRLPEISSCLYVCEERTVSQVLRSLQEVLTSSTRAFTPFVDLTLKSVTSFVRWAGI